MIGLRDAMAHGVPAADELRRSIDAWRAEREAHRATRREVLERRWGDWREMRQRYEADWQEMMRHYGEAVSAFHRVVELAGRRSDRPGVRWHPPALAGLDRAAAAPRARAVALPPERTEGLTARQREIARLIAVGMTNRQIATELVLTEGTVANHVRHILLRLGMRCRAQVAAWVVAGDGRGHELMSRRSGVGPGQGGGAGVVRAAGRRG
jgi:DNA-binding CsgD family transcriptional regulator